jgi:hypothetical protein
MEGIRILCCGPRCRRRHEEPKEVGDRAHTSDAGFKGHRGLKQRVAGLRRGSLANQKPNALGDLRQREVLERRGVAKQLGQVCDDNLVGQAKGFPVVVEVIGPIPVRLGRGMVKDRSKPGYEIGRHVTLP